MLLLLLGIPVPCTAGRGKSYFENLCALRNWCWYEGKEAGEFDWKCVSRSGNYRGVGKNRQRNENPPKYKVKGNPEDPNPSKRPEAYCQIKNPAYPGGWQPAPCPWATFAEAQNECEVNGGTWTALSEIRAYCAFPPGGIAVVVHDDDGDGLIFNTEFHCEGLDPQGNPNGEEVVCPGEDE